MEKDILTKLEERVLRAARGIFMVSRKGEASDAAIVSELESAKKELNAVASEIDELIKSYNHDN